MATAANPYASFLGDKEPYFILRSTVPQIQELTANLAPEQLVANPSPGKWSIHQIVAHLADCETVFQFRGRLVMFEDTPKLASFDQDRWLNGWMREQEPWEETLDRFRVLRNSSIRLFTNAEGHDLTRLGVHDERGPITITDIVNTMAGHDINHLQQIERVAKGK